MYIKNITLKNFRNYIDEKAEFKNEINIFQGKNAQGKTNLLEAIYFLSCAKSFRTNKEDEMILKTSDFSSISLCYNKNQLDSLVEIKLRKGLGKNIAVDKNQIKRISDLFGRLICVIFVPDELKMIKDAPSYRRKFMDIEIAKIRPKYLEDLKEYETSLKNKNALLKSNMNKEKLFTLIDIFNKKIAAAAKSIVASRAYFISLLNERILLTHEEISEKKEKLFINYKKCVNDIKNTEEELYLKMTKEYNKEACAGYSLFGPHREDIEFLINGENAVSFGSQGQQRSIILSVKIAIADIIYEKTNEKPVLLLDDVFSELDSYRLKALLSVVKKYQTFITTASKIPENIDKNNISFFNISSGKIKKAL